MANLVDVANDLTSEQRQVMSDKLEILMRKYGTFSRRGNNKYFEGTAEGLNIAYKLINEIDDDYNSNDYLDLMS